MTFLYKFLCLLSLIFVVVGCSDNSPGSLEGTWSLEASGFPEMVIRYEEGQEVHTTTGHTSRVEYEHQGNDVFITYLDGLGEGATVRVTMSGEDSAILSGTESDSASTPFATLKRIK